MGHVFSACTLNILSLACTARTGAPAPAWDSSDCRGSCAVLLYNTPAVARNLHATVTNKKKRAGLPRRTNKACVTYAVLQEVLYSRPHPERVPAVTWFDLWIDHGCHHHHHHHHRSIPISSACPMNAGRVGGLASSNCSITLFVYPMICTRQIKKQTNDAEGWWSCVVVVVVVVVFSPQQIKRSLPHPPRVYFSIIARGHKTRPGAKRALANKKKGSEKYNNVLRTI